MVACRGGRAPVVWGPPEVLWRRLTGKARIRVLGTSALYTHTHTHPWKRWKHDPISDSRLRLSSFTFKWNGCFTLSSLVQSTPSQLSKAGEREKKFRVSLYSYCFPLACQAVRLTLSPYRALCHVQGIMGILLHAFPMRWVLYAPLCGWGHCHVCLKPAQRHRDGQWQMQDLHQVQSHSRIPGTRHCRQEVQLFIHGLGSPNYKQATFEVRQSLLGLFSRVNYRVFKGISMTPLKRDLVSSTARANFENLT